MADRDRIELRGLRLLGTIGVLEHEQRGLQPLEIDVVVICDLAPAGRSDDLSETVDYGALCGTIEAVVAGRSFALLEALAEALADAVLAEPRAEAVVVGVRKLRPPVPQQLDTSGVRITRSR
ncbi:MAG: dihydroneopterin aldolase [Acidimicrobiia bacterium]